MTHLVLLIEIAPEFSIVGQPPTARIGSPYSYAFVAVGGSGSVTWSLAPGSSLPGGWSLNSAGTLAHPTNVSGAGIFEFFVRATDSDLRSVDRYFFVQKASPLP